MSKTSKMLIGCYNIAICQLRNDCYKKDYAFALFPEDAVEANIGVGDTVLVDTARGEQIAEIKKIIPQIEYDGVAVTKEIICKVDYSRFNARQENRKRIGNLKNQMDNLISQNQNLMLYQAMAQQNPEMAALLDEYKKLTGIN